MKTPKCNCDTNDTESFCPQCCPEEYECVEQPHIQAYFEKKFAKGREPLEEGDELNGRMYFHLQRAWHFTCKDFDSLSDKRFTIENLCKNYDIIANKSGIGPKILAKLREIASKHGIEVITKYRDQTVKGPYTIPIR